MSFQNAGKSFLFLIFILSVFFLPHISRAAVKPRKPQSQTLVKRYETNFENTIEKIEQIFSDNQKKASPETLKTVDGSVITQEIDSLKSAAAALPNISTYEEQVAAENQIRLNIKNLQKDIAGYLKLIKKSSNAPKGRSKPDAPKNTVSVKDLKLEKVTYNPKQQQFTLKWSGGPADGTLDILEIPQGKTDWQTIAVAVPTKNKIFVVDVPETVLPNDQYCFELSLNETNLFSNQPCYISKSTGSSVGSTNKSFSVNSVTSTSANFSWKSMPGAKSYALYRNGFLEQDHINSTSYAGEPILLPDTTYTYTVVGENSTDDAPTYLTADYTPLKPAFFASILHFLEREFAVNEAEASDKLPSQTVTLRTAPQVIPLQGTLDVLAVPVGIIGKENAEMDSVSSINDKIFGNDPKSNSLANFWQYAGGKRLSIVGSVVDTKTAGIIRVAVPGGKDDFVSISKDKITLELVNKYLYENPQTRPAYSAANVIIYVFPQLDSAVAGIAPGLLDKNQGNTITSVFSTDGRMTINGDQPSEVYSHEFGHVLGLYHALSLACKDPMSISGTNPDPSDISFKTFFNSSKQECALGNLNDSDDIMNASDPLAYSVPDSYRQSQLKWRDLIRIRDSSQAGFYRLAADETSQGSVLSIESDPQVIAYPDFRSNSIPDVSSFYPINSAGALTVKFRFPKNASLPSFLTSSANTLPPETTFQYYSLNSGVQKLFKLYAGRSFSYTDSSRLPATKNWTLLGVNYLAKGSEAHADVFIGFHDSPILTELHMQVGSGYIELLQWSSVNPGKNYIQNDPTASYIDSVTYRLTEEDPSQNVKVLYEGSEKSFALYPKDVGGQTHTFAIRAIHTIKRAASDTTAIGTIVGDPYYATFSFPAANTTTPGPNTPIIIPCDRGAIQLCPAGYTLVPNTDEICECKLDTAENR